MTTSFGQMLRKLRKERKWTQEDLSKKIGISKIQICHLEKGHSIPSSSTLNKIVKVFGVDFDTLYDATLR